ncbi:hypothetical protein [Thalassospira sp.]|uniref:phage head spike fiber domain-containing protein n=1 Tax=Thalassospira sp. TaxID=1912094 RepID=UPI002733B5A3|nr:hypothetical protein [Thalassospira sp.]MDP2697581.1 hypothetical protein [Thalassospira sp.]
MAMRVLPLTGTLTVGRASPKMVRNPGGILIPVLVDQPAFDHDAAGRPLGLLIEEARSNLLRHSNSFSNILWERDGGVTVSASAIAAPDGAAHAMRLDLPGGAAGLYQRVDNLATGAVYAFAIWMRAVAGSASVMLGGIDGPSGHEVTVGESWHRVGFAESASDSTRYPKIRSANGQAASVVIWNAQLERGPNPTSDIISNGSPAMRAGDDVRLLPGDWFRAGAGCFVFDLEVPPVWDGTGIWRIVQLYSASLNDDHLDLGFDPAAGQLRISLRRAGQQIISQSLYGALAPGSRVKIALAFDDDGVAVACGDGVLKSPPGFALPRNFSNIVIGSYGGVDKHLNGYLRGISYWPERLPDARLLAISTVTGE